VIGVCLHYGNWELGGNYLSSLGVSFHSLVFRQIDADFDRILTKIRRNCNIGLLHQRGGLKKAVEYLRRGEMITFLGDQDGTRNGFFQSFMGLHCSFPRALELFVRKTEAVLLPVVLKHDDSTDGYVACVYPPLGHAVDFRDRLPELHAVIRDFYEEQILTDPAQWLLFYNRFRFRHDDFLREQGIFEQVSREYKKAWQG
jgi:lauroyl/myristoyl acyltransferase